MIHGLMQHGSMIIIKAFDNYREPKLTNSNEMRFPSVIPVLYCLDSIKPKKHLQISIILCTFAYEYKVFRQTLMTRRKKVTSCSGNDNHE